ncbi:SRPBCC family protein [Streptomyces minutiscleroticus]|uniref:SRPBCC family protein n=1 Tax=Streptomyces minutiscleroticus TaxID=68238 RepID=A0A918NRW4_9ACTN|nr:SRPBCC family protein [Streptomyces minutiscleroticus]GGX90062.1 hypothetical protein GCM10010358_50110 [Streptomyces minutiscleroticus]
MAEYEQSRTIAAPPEQVFEQAANVGQMDSWMPRDLHLHVNVEDLPAVTVHEDAPAEDIPALLRTERDQMRIEWGTREDGSYAGWLQVSGIGSGSSEVIVHLSFFDERHDPGPQLVQDALVKSLSRLEEQIRLRFEPTAG